MNRSTSSGTQMTPSTPRPRAVRPVRRGPTEAVDGRTSFPESRVDRAVLVVADRRRALLAHDIGHAFGTVLMLAAAVENTPATDPELQIFARQLAAETRRVGELVDSLIRPQPDRAPSCVGTPETRLDLLVRSVTEPIRATSGATLTVRTVPAHVTPPPLELWRAVRNLLGNALDAIALDGHIRVVLSVQGRFAVVDIDDDGPGVRDGFRHSGGLGLGIVEDLAAGWGGTVELGPGALGGCRARLLVPLAEPRVAPSVALSAASPAASVNGEPAAGG